MSTNLPAVIPAATTTPVANGPANAPRRNLFQRLGDWFRDPKISTASKVAAGAGAVLATGALVVGAQSLLGMEDGLSGLFNKKKSRRNRTQNLNGTHNHGGKQGRKKNAGKGGKKKHKNRSKPYHGKGYIPTVKLK